VAAVEGLRGADDAPLLRAAHLASGSPPPRGRVDIAVATPGEGLQGVRFGVLRPAHHSRHPRKLARRCSHSHQMSSHGCMTETNPLSSCSRCCCPPKRGQRPTALLCVPRLQASIQSRRQPLSVCFQHRLAIQFTKQRRSH
jgi:hypothetical protein